MPFSNQQKVFLDELITIGDENQCCKTLGLDASLILEWDEDKDFRLKKKRVLEHYSENISTRIAVAALSSLYEVLQNGDLVTTHSTTNKQILDLEGNIQRLQNKTVSSKSNKNPPWAVKAGMQLVMIQKLEASISHSLTNLIDNNIISADLREQILQVLDKNDEMVQSIFSGTVSKTIITEEMLASIQATLLGS